MRHECKAAYPKGQGLRAMKRCLWLSASQNLHYLLKPKNPNSRISSFGTSPIAIYGVMAQETDRASPIAEDLIATVQNLCKEGRLKEALNVLPLMDEKGIQAEYFTYASLLQGCLQEKATAEGKLVHLHMIKHGFDSIYRLGAKLFVMHLKQGRLEDARQVFEKMPQRNVSLWNAMIAGYTKRGLCDQALELFEQMQLEGTKADQFTYASVVNACAQLGHLGQGKKVHYDIKNSGLDSDIVLQNALVDMYVKCGNIEDAWQVFDKMPHRDVVSWTTMIGGYAKHGELSKAVECFKQMQWKGEKPNQITMANVLRACAGLAHSDGIKQVQTHLTRNGFECHLVSMNALVDMYAKCGNMECARRVFDGMPARDVVSWTAIVTGYARCGNVINASKFFDDMPKRNLISWAAMIAGYTKAGQGEEALRLFCEIQVAGLKPDRPTFVSVVRACAGLAALEQGRQIHGGIIKSASRSEVMLHNALIDMYAKCGIMDDAHRMFREMPNKSIVSWTTMIVACGRHGRGREALQLFEQMHQAGESPDDVTFIGVLFACSHAGLVDDGWRYFHSMSEDHDITPRVEHYGCMVDLLGRNGYVQEAYEFISRMPIKPSGGVWGALLSACRAHGDLALGELAAVHLFELEPRNAGPYMALSSIYAAAGMWDDVSKVRLMMKNRGLKKEPGCSWIHVKGMVHAFVQADRSHPQMEEIYAVLHKLLRQMKEIGYVPDTSSLMQDVDE